MKYISYHFVNKTFEHLFSYCKLVRSGEKALGVRYLIYSGQ